MQAGQVSLGFLNQNHLTRLPNLGGQSGYRLGPMPADKILPTRRAVFNNCRLSDNLKFKI